MKHSIIIPHRARLKHLAACVFSIRSAAARASLVEWRDFEILIIHNGEKLTLSAMQLDQAFHGIWIVHADAMPIFNKPKLINIGIEASGGRTLTFLDADAIVGPEWFHGPERLLGDLRHVTRLCYRVKRIDTKPLEHLLYYGRPSTVLIHKVFAQWDTLKLAYEGHGGVDTTVRGESTEVFGNSQFSIRRDVLGGVRMDEAYEGHGFEDLDFIQQIYHRHKETYKGHISENPNESIVHLKHAWSSDWRTTALTHKNRARYRDKWHKKQ